MLPVSSLCEPPRHLLLRDTSECFIEALKKEMIENPTGENICKACCVMIWPNNFCLHASTELCCNVM